MNKSNNQKQGISKIKTANYHEHKEAKGSMLKDRLHTERPVRMIIKKAK